MLNDGVGTGTPSPVQLAGPNLANDFAERTRSPVNPVTTNSDESARRTLIEIAARLTDREVGGNGSSYWLRAFRKNFRHMAVTYGLTFAYPTLGGADVATDAALDSKAKTEAA